MLSKTRAALALGTLLPLMHACGLDDVNQGRVRVLNATSEYTTLDLLDVDSKSNTDTLISGTAAGTVSDYQKLDAGTYTFQVQGSSSSTAAATSDSTSISKTDHYVVVASITGTTATAKVLSEEEDAPNSGRAKVRVYNAAPTETGSVDVYLTAHDCTALDGTDIAFGPSVSGLQTTFTQINATSSGTTWNLCVTGAGSQTDLRLTGKATFTDGEIATLVLSRTSGGVALNGLLLPQQGPIATIANTLARLRVVNDGANKAAVAVSINGTSATTTNSSPNIGVYNSVTAGDATVTISIGGVPVTPPAVKFTAGGDYTLLVAGTSAAPIISLFTDSNTPSTSSALPVKMRLVNGLNGPASAVSLTSDGTSVTDGTAFGAASLYTNVAVSTNNTNSDLELAAGGTTLTSLSANLASGTVNTIFLLGDYVDATTTTSYSAKLRTDRSSTGSTTGTSTGTGSTGTTGTSGN